MTDQSESPPLHLLLRALAEWQRLAIEDPRHDRIIFGHSAPADCLRYVAARHWTVVGHRLELLVSPTSTVTVEVLARDQRGDFIAVSPVQLEGQFGMGIVNLCTAEAQFARLESAGRVN